MASAGKSVIASLQKIGRGMRVSEGKTTFEVWDFLDEDGSVLERHSARRAATYQSEGYHVQS
jgi:superfamily II DNA or RNA helicase